MTALSGSVLAAGLAGVTEELRLPEEIVGDPATWTSERREAAGVTRLPTSPLEAAERLAAAPVLATAVGEELHDALLTVRRAEGERFAQATPAELVELTRWRF